MLPRPRPAESFYSRSVSNRFTLALLRREGSRLKNSLVDFGNSDEDGSDDNDTNIAFKNRRDERGKE